MHTNSHGMYILRTPRADKEVGVGENDFQKWAWQQIIVGSGRGLYPDLLTEPVHSP